MKVSIITVTYNSAQTLADTIRSVAKQKDVEVEFIIVDGKSKDGTLQVIERHQDQVHRWISEPDKGLYDAINKGIRMATGDIVGVLHSDDFYHREDTLAQVVNSFQEYGVESVFGDVIFVKPDDLTKTVRYYDSGKFSPEKFKKGIMPAHPSFFTYRRNYEKYGFYRTDYKIAADFELLVRFLHTHRLSYYHLPVDLLTMRTGGLSTKSWKSNLIINQEDLRACRENGIHTNYLRLYSRYFSKAMELFPFLF